jgi:hypothetical protein
MCCEEGGVRRAISASGERAAHYSREITPARRADDAAHDVVHQFRDHLIGRSAIAR